MKLYLLIDLCLSDLGVIDSYKRNQGKMCDVVPVSGETTAKLEFIWWYIRWCHMEVLWEEQIGRRGVRESAVGDTSNACMRSLIWSLVMFH